MYADSEDRAGVLHKEVFDGAPFRLVVM